MTEPKIIFFDLETIPNLQEALENWCDLGAKKFGPPSTMSASLSTICSFGYRIFGETKSIGVNAWDFKAWRKDVNNDKALCKKIFEVLNSADCVVTFNGKKFDMPFVQTRMLIHKLPLLRKDIIHVDLCKIAKDNLFLLNNRLKTVAKYLMNDAKEEHEGWPLWTKVHGGMNRVRDREAEKKMSKYNIKDVDLMIPLFKELRPLITTIPNYNLYMPAKSNVCPSCGSTRLRSEGIRTTKTRRYRRYICFDCHSYCRTDLNDELPRT